MFFLLFYSFFFLLDFAIFLYLGFRRLVFSFLNVSLGERGSVRSTSGVFAQRWVLSGGPSSDNYVPTPLPYLCLHD